MGEPDPVGLVWCVERLLRIHHLFICIYNPPPKLTQFVRAASVPDGQGPPHGRGGGERGVGAGGGPARPFHRGGPGVAGICGECGKGGEVKGVVDRCAWLY